VLQGFGSVLKIITRKTEKRHRPQIAEPSEVSVDQLLSSQSSHQHPSHPDSSDPHSKNHRFSLPEAVTVREDQVTKAASLKPLLVVAIESGASKDASPGIESIDLPSNTGHIEAHTFSKQQSIEAQVHLPDHTEHIEAQTFPKQQTIEAQVHLPDHIEAQAFPKQQTIEAQVLSLDNEPSMFTRVEKEAPEERLDESDLMSPEAPRVLDEEEEEDPGPDLSAQRSARQERDRLAQEEAERLAQATRQQAEAVLAVQNSEIAKMQDAAQNILSKYQ
jgi:hypothetical protein